MTIGTDTAQAMLPAFTSGEMNEFAREALRDALELERMEALERISEIDRQLETLG